MVPDDEVGVPGSPDSSSVECLAGVLDAGPADDELDAEVADVDDSSDADEDAVDDSSAQATPGAEAIAPPMPSAIASAPTRPMYFAYAVGLDPAERERRHCAGRS